MMCQISNDVNNIKCFSDVYNLDIIYCILFDFFTRVSKKSQHNIFYDFMFFRQNFKIYFYDLSMRKFLSEEERDELEFLIWLEKKENRAYANETDVLIKDKLNEQSIRHSPIFSLFHQMLKLYLPKVHSEMF
jgi:hypothetical protein